MKTACSTITPVAVIHTPFKEKFGIPRQPGVAPSAKGVVELLPPYDQPQMLRGLEAFSHVWLIWCFHAVPRGQWQPLVRPPRLGGNRRVGVFASRAPFRPNPLGLSAVKLEAIEGSRLLVSGVDLMDGTPLLDIKPYVPYSDCIPQATQGFARGAPEARLQVSFSSAAERQLLQHEHGEELRRLIVELLQVDPRPAYRAQGQGDYAFRLHDFDLRWRVAADGRVVVQSLASDDCSRKQ
jgi:tRNA (adenine37-N6)-methyltransferase